MSLVGFKAQNHSQQTKKRGAKDAVDDRGTDPAFIAQLEERFGGPFDLDVAAAPHNAKAPKFYTREDDGLSQPWSIHRYPNAERETDRGNQRVWCNPPYSDIRPWVEKAWIEYYGRVPAASRRGYFGHLSPPLNTFPSYPPPLIVMLLPANRVEQKWWQDLVEPFRDQGSGMPLRVEFLPGRMRFERPGVEIGPKGDRPPFGCCLLIWGRGSRLLDGSLS